MKAEGRHAQWHRVEPHVRRSEPGGGEDFGDSWLLEDVLRAVLARVAAGEWSVDVGEFWCSVTPPGHRSREQGWKLHVSATQLSAAVVLARVADVLVRAGCAFKFARSLAHLGGLLSSECDRGSGGKFITAYPADDEQFRSLVPDLDRVTDGLPGPLILSDRRLRPGSLVHYRYGVFEAPPVFTEDGVFVSMLTGPDGQVSVDKRQAWFSAPPWAPPPSWASSSGPGSPGAASSVPQPQAGRVAGTEPAVVLIGDRFVMREAIRHSYRGGVFLATDRESGAEVVVKQARPHVMSSLTGTDGRDLLRHEAEMLDLLGPLGLAPRRLALVDQMENLFLVEELMPGVTMREWVVERVGGEWQGGGAPLGAAVEIADRLVELVSAVHDQGLVLCDLKPDNVMLIPDGRLVLVDLEHATRIGSRVAHALTSGYAGPERMSTPWFGPAPSQRSDLFSLGATMLFLLSGMDPALPADEPAGRPVRERLTALVASAGVRMAGLRRLSPLLLGLTHDDPDQRWPLTQAREFLASVTEATATTDPVEADPMAGGGRLPAEVADRLPAKVTDRLPVKVADRPPAKVADPLPGEVPDRLPNEVVDRLLADGLRHLLDTMTPGRAALWRPDRLGETMDHCNVQSGAAGTLEVLTRAAHVLGGDSLHAGVAAAARWVDARRFDIPRLLPGLYFGRSGTAWALYDAARLLDDEVLASHALELVRRVPVVWPNPDICHGAAGAGLAHVYLWRATGDPRLARRIVECADGLLAAARERNGRLLWPVLDVLDPARERMVHYGFAHGVAGVGAFLLSCGLATGRHEYLDAARRAGDTLHAAADVEGPAAWWPRDEDEGPGVSRLMHWCSGSSGVGTFLIRLWAATGERTDRELAEAAAVAVRRDAWCSPIAVCHGLAGEGDFLLDLHDYTGEERYREWASELAAVMYARHTIRNGLTLLPDESGATVTAGYGTGLSGALGFLLRLRHGGPRWWMPDGPFAGTAFRLPRQAGPGQRRPGSCEPVRTGGGQAQN